MKKFYSLFATVALVVGVTAQTNLIPNPGFENWTGTTPDSWYVTGSTVAKSTTIFHSSTASLAYTSPSSGNKTISPTTDIPVTQGVTYVFSGWILDNVNNATFKYWNQFRTASADTGANNMQAGAYSTDNAAWVPFYAEATPNATAIVARPGLRIYGENSSSGGVIYLDDIMFYDKSTLSTINIKDFDNGVKMNTIVDNDLKLQLPSRSTVNIYSVDGKLISSNRVNNGESIQLSHLAKGNYIVTVQDNFQNKVSRKIIKK